MEMLIEQAGDCPECGEGASDGTSWSITGQSTAQCPNGHEWDVDF